MDKGLIVWNLTNNFQNVGVTPAENEFLIPWDASKFADIDAVYLVVVGGPTDGTGCDFNNEPHLIVTVRNWTDSSDLYTYNSYGAYPTANITADITSYLPNAAAGEKILHLKCSMGCGATATCIQAFFYIVLKAPADGSAIKARVLRDVGWDNVSRATTYTEVDSKRLWWDSTLYGLGDGSLGGIEAIYFGSSFKYQTATAGYTAYVELYDNTNVAQITELSTTIDTIAYYKSADIQGSLTDESELTARIKRTVPGSPVVHNTILKNAHLIIDIDDLQKYETDFMLLHDNHSNSTWSTNGYTDPNRLFTTYKDYASGVTKVLYAESVAKKNHATDVGYMRVEDDGTAMTDGETQHTTTGYTRYRPANALTEPADGSKINIEGKGYTTTASSLLGYCFRVIMQVSGFSRETTSAVKDIIGGSGFIPFAR